MKFNKKFLIILIYTFISFVSQINYGICSDNGPVVQQPVQSTPTIPNQQQMPVTNVPQQMQQPLAPPNIPTGATTNAKQGFLPNLFNMIKSLLNIIILIIAIGGIIVLYRRMKSKTSGVQKPKKEKAQTIENIEPSTVSEAVSSFVRHKIKRTS